MMGSSSKHHLKQLLNQDQDPFVLDNYIDDKRLQINKPPRTTKTTPTPTSISIFSTNLCKTSCFCSSHQSPDIKNSPLNRKNSNTLFVHIPPKTAALLLEAALRIQNQSEKNPKPSKNHLGFGLFGSIFKRIRRRKKDEIKRDDEIKVSVKDILSWETGIVNEVQETKKTLGVEEKRVSDVGLSCSCNSRVSSTWSESNEEKSLDLETSTSRSEASEETESVVLQTDDFLLSDKGTPFRFSLSPPHRRSPELLSPATSPNRRKNQDEKQNKVQHLDSEGKEEKEHCSPVSVLDVEIDVDVEEHYDDEDEEDIELERSFAAVEKARQKLLQKLRRFERLAELDPLELEKRIAEDDDEDEDEDEDEDVNDSEDEQEKSGLPRSGDSNLRIGDILKGTCSNIDMKRLVIDLMGDEAIPSGTRDRILASDKPCRRLKSLKNVERNTIKVMVEMDFRSDGNKWKNNAEHVEDTVVAVELAIFGFLVEELSMELVHSSGVSEF